MPFEHANHEMYEKNILTSLEEAAHEAISGAASYAHATMKPMGNWLCELRSTVSFTAQYVVFRAILGTNPLSEKEKTKFRVWIESQQDLNGCWGLLPKGLGEEHLSTSVEGYFALKLLGVSSEQANMQAARQFILTEGGLSKVGVTTQLLLALVGLLPWSELPKVPPEILLLPDHGPLFNIFSLAYWARTSAVPICILRHHEPIYHGIVSPDFLDELWTNPQRRKMTYASSLKDSWKGGELTTFSGTMVDKSLGLLEPALRLLPTRSLALTACVRFILDRIDDGGYGAFWAANFGAVLALISEGFSTKHPVVVHLVRAIDQYLWKDEEGSRMQVTHGPVWDTGLMALGLLESGTQTETMDREYLPIEILPQYKEKVWVTSTIRLPLNKVTIQWFKDRQILDVRGDCHRQKSRLVPGGWCYQNCNTYYPDNDDTLVSLLCIVMHRPEELRSKSCLSAIEFLLGMQCSNGGWACFDAWDNRNHWLNKTPFGQGNEFFDPTVPDITGRVLECFGLLLETNDAFAEKTGELLISGKLSLRLRHSCFRAIQYLASEQNSEGLWQSRWHVNYLNGTYSVLCGLKFFLKDMSNSLGSDITERLVSRPLAWITSMQNEDGGWGESVTTYRNPSEAGCGTSTATQTAWAIMGLLAHLPPTDIAIVKGIQYLVTTQTTGPYVSESDGSGIGAGAGATWRQKEYVSVGFPDILWLDYASSRHGYPMMALGRWLHQMPGFQGGNPT